MAAITTSHAEGLISGGHVGSDRYRLLEELGQSEFALVWSALDTQTQHKVAIKILRQQYVRNALIQTRFVRSARMMAGIRHNAVVRVLDIQSDSQGRCFFVMELVRGTDLHDAVLRKDVLLEQATSLILRVGAALSELHGQGLVHRNLKPENILLDPMGAPRLIDFDLYEETDAAEESKAMVYRAPEMMDAPQNAGPEADVYSLAMILVFAIRGGHPSLSSVRDGSLVATLPCDHTLKEFLQRAIARNPQDRLRNAEEFCEKLSIVADIQKANRDSGMGSEFGNGMTYMPPDKAEFEDGPTRLPAPKTDYDYDGGGGQSLLNINIGKGVLLEGEDPDRPTMRYKPPKRRRAAEEEDPPTTRFKANAAPKASPDADPPTTRYRPGRRHEDDDFIPPLTREERAKTAAPAATEAPPSPSNKKLILVLVALLVVLAGIIAVILKGN